MWKLFGEVCAKVNEMMQQRGENKWEGQHSCCDWRLENQIILSNSNSITNDQNNNIRMNLKYNRLDMKKRAAQPNCSMKLRTRPSTSKTHKAPLPAKSKPKQNKDSRLFGTDLTNQPAPIANLSVMQEEEVTPRCQVQPYMGSILAHMEGLDAAFLAEMSGRVGRAQGNEWAVSAQMRRVLLRWLIQVGRKFQVMHETIHICAQIIDFLLVCEPARISKANFQLLGIAALFVASKYNEIHTWEAEKYVFVCDGLYTVEQLFEMEGVILTATSFNLQFPTIHQFAGVALQHHGDRLAEAVTMLSNLAMFDFSLFNRFRKRHLACVILYIALKIESPQQVRSRDVIEASNIPEEIFRECSKMLLTLYQDRERIQP